MPNTRSSTTCSLGRASCSRESSFHLKSIASSAAFADSVKRGHRLGQSTGTRALKNPSDFAISVGFPIFSYSFPPFSRLTVICSCHTTTCLQRPLPLRFRTILGFQRRRRRLSSFHAGKPFGIICISSRIGLPYIWPGRQAADGFEALFLVTGFSEGCAHLAGHFARKGSFFNRQLQINHASELLGFYGSISDINFLHTSHNISLGNVLQQPTLPLGLPLLVACLGEPALRRTCRPTGLYLPSKFRIL